MPLKRPIVPESVLNQLFMTTTTASKSTPDQGNNYSLS